MKPPKPSKNNFLLQNWIIILIWIFGLFLRLYRQSDLLPFYYDQGRDALMASDIIHFRNFPAIGPTTGISGIYLGPFWYYLIVPGYLLGQGNPVIASSCIAFLESLTIPLIYFFILRNWKKNAAILAALIWTFSRYLTSSDRWFSNPSPLPFFVLLSLITAVAIIKNKKHKLLPALVLFLGLTLQLEAASAIFFFPVILLFFIFSWPSVRKIKPKIWFQSLVVFCFLLLPQLAFDLKNHFFITKSLIGFLTGHVNTDTGKTWILPSVNFLVARIAAFYQYFFSKLDVSLSVFSLPVAILFVIGLIYLIIRYHQDIFIRLLLIWLLLPCFILLFFNGNYGNLYDYYLTGFYPVFIILAGIIFTLPRQIYLNLLFSILFLIYFFHGNLIHLYHYLSDGIDGPENVVYGNEIAAVDLICTQNKIIPGHIDIYVPPVTPNTYNYLFSWRHSEHLCPPFDSASKTQYLIYEVDPNNPQNLKNWQSKYQYFKVINRDKFGGISVETLTE